jgi:hypothetical protein
MSHHAPVREEHLLAHEHHVPVYGQPGKTRLVATEDDEDDKHPVGARDMQRLTENHRFNFKKQPEIRAWHLT